MIEDEQNATNYSPNETYCEEFFRRTVKCDPEGRYIVRLPFKENLIHSLGDNNKTALHRFQLLERRLARNPTLGAQYVDFMSEYHRLGHMEPVTENTNEKVPSYYMPYHPVVRESSTTTKVRVVYDASCKTNTGPSLNDCLLVGPIVQEDLRSIIMRARTHAIMLIADVEKMYHQILIHPDDIQFQRVFWRSSIDQPITAFELKTVTYGTASAPFLATRVLKQLATDEAGRFPIAAKVVETDFYVDDLFSGSATVAEAIELQKQLDLMLAAGGMQLRKWATNNQTAIMNVVPENRALQSDVNFDRDQTIKTLGLHWEPMTDQLKYQIHLKLTPNTKLTKRCVLSYIAQIFDPLGLVGPVVVTAKAFMQTLWALVDENGTVWDWDRELPTHLHESWMMYHSELSLLNMLRIDRFVLLPKAIEIELQLFSDASEIAYGSCAYLRSTDANGHVKVSLHTSRSRVAPLKKQSIPRLELCGAALSAELFQKIRTSLRLPAVAFLWTDSTIVLSWLKGTPSMWTRAKETVILNWLTTDELSK
ncbi:uncharacterized protein LOC128745972 [Sabethes cyaneus]|uniref:uncharacterized protein LOC128745972 n=1 Tax=Sabethes cyaneus TaxID=53552 RepID=UPI00237EB8B5|nr:uncharacterized protein LOC128745972 [Sabethes cyaneus]